MAAKPAKFVKRGSLYVPSSSGFTRAAVASEQRKTIRDYALDASALLTAYDRKRVMSIGRYLFNNNSVVRGCINEMAQLASAVVIPQFEGEDREWGKQAEDYLYESGKFLDLRGWPYDETTFNRLLVLSVVRDGDQFILLTEDGFGEPKIQVIPAHRIGTRDYSDTIKGGEFAGRRIQDGVIQDDYGRAIGYRVLGDTAEEDRDYSSNDLFPAFDPDYSDQVRGFSALGSSVIDWQDLAETRRFELMAQKLIASIAVVESNEEGEAPMASLAGGGVAISDETDEDNVPVYGQEMLGGEVRYFRSGSGSKIEIPSGDRPTANQREFADAVAREALHGIGWSWDFGLNPTKMSGGPARIIVSKVNKKLRHIRDKILSPVRRRIDGWRIAKAIKNGRLPTSDEWFRWGYQFDAELTADEKYSSDVAMQEFRAGFISKRDVMAKRGLYYDDVMATKQAEVDDLLVRAAAIAKRHDIPMPVAITLLQDNASYSTVTNATPEPVAQPATTQDTQQ
jgi:hypothetical protein